MLKRLIEVALPLKEVSEQSAREKAIGHGNVSTLHIWWARRPLAACRAVVLASLIRDPHDPERPEQFRRFVMNLLPPVKAGSGPTGDASRASADEDDARSGGRADGAAAAGGAATAAGAAKPKRGRRKRAEAARPVSAATHACDAPAPASRHSTFTI
ncbi:MAG: DUF1156 domain-containing protein [Phycisphaerales bacterium]|nr:MAG: DUF1156 domain-containing protein [Phycisphaerales bacterium]